ncbi:MAG: MFS transporter [Nakamurella sp.]
MTSTPVSSPISQRLDKLPFTRKHLRMLTGSGVGWALDAMDVGLISFIIAALTAQWGITKGEAGWIASVGFIGMAIGASVGGLVADRLGRRHVFALTLLIYGVATGASALVGGIGLLLVFRFFTGLGLGAELPVASTYVSEFAPSRVRGRMIVILEAFWALGWTASALIGYFVIPASSAGWRWAFAIGAVPAIYAIVIRLHLPESPRWLATRGRLDEADRIVTEFEAAAGLAPLPAEAATKPDTASATTAVVGRSTASRLAALWSPEFRTRTASLWVVWVCVNFAYYGAFIWIPSILYSNGFDLVKSFGFTLIITLAQLPGYAVSAWLIEVWGRRMTLSVFLAGSAASAFAFGNVTSAGLIIAFGMSLSFFNLGAWGALYAVTPEIYPTSLRGTGAGWAAAIGRVAAIIAPLTVPVLLAAGGSALTFAVFGVFFAIAMLAAWGLLDLKGVPLDDR